jgi:hypothetical protein
MLRPSVLAGLKQAGDFPRFGIDARQVGAFLPITLSAGERQIIQMCSSAVLFGHDVLDMEGPTKQSLR